MDVVAKSKRGETYIIDIGNNMGIFIDDSRKTGPVNITNYLSRAQTPFEEAAKGLDPHALLRSAKPSDFYEVDESQLTL